MDLKGFQSRKKINTLYLFINCHFNYALNDIYIYIYIFFFFHLEAFLFVGLG